MKSKLWNEMKNMTDVELNAKLVQLQDKLFKVKFRNLTAPVKNPLEIREIRRNIARIKTLNSFQKKKESK
jgi:large subunit ribosomal protein L29